VPPVADILEFPEFKAILHMSLEMRLPDFEEAVAEIPDHIQEWREKMLWISLADCPSRQGMAQTQMWSTRSVD
jgi:hypothetical protein